MHRTHPRAAATCASHTRDTIRNHMKETWNAHMNEHALSCCRAPKPSKPDVPDFDELMAEVAAAAAPPPPLPSAALAVQGGATSEGPAAGSGGHGEGEAGAGARAGGVGPCAEEEEGEEARAGGVGPHAEGEEAEEEEDDLVLVSSDDDDDEGGRFAVVDLPSTVKKQPRSPYEFTQARQGEGCWNAGVHVLVLAEWRAWAWTRAGWRAGGGGGRFPAARLPGTS